MSQGGGTQTTTQTQTIPPWLQDAAQGFLGAAGDVSQLPYEPYTGQRVADLSPLQQDALQGFGDLSQGLPSMYSAEDMINNTLQGNYQNPFASQGVNGGGQYQFNPLGSGGQFNPGQISAGGQFNPSSVSGGSNPYEGENPYFQSSMNKGLDDITRAYKNGTAAQTDAMFANAHAFGGSAHQEQMANNERGLGDSLGNFANSMRQGQFDRSANLAESGLGRNLNAQQFNNTLGNQTFENAAQRGLQAGSLNNQFGQTAFENAANRGIQTGQFNNTLGNQAFENAAQRGLNAGQFNANLGSSAYEQERNRQLGAVGASTNLFGSAQQGLNNQLNAGDIERRQNQSLLDSQYGDFNEWRNYPEHQLGVYGNALGSVMGRAGGSTNTTGELPPPDRVGQGLGIAALGSMLGRGSGKGG